jgi:ABC-type Fe3+ transport system substrate-binding protein
MRLGMSALTLIALATPLTATAQEVSGLAAMHDLRREKGKLCMSDHWHSGSGTGASKEAAQKAAVRSWIDFTDLEYGGRWASFSNAASKKVSYSKESSGWSASVEGRPCYR